jgi:DNA-binding MarR family transcriptional regulator
MTESPPSLEFLLTELSTPLHEPVRLGILMLLHLHRTLAFSILQKALGVTPGNLNSHLTRLEGEGLVTKEKTFVDLRPRTLLLITDKGRAALQTYSGLLQQVLMTIQSP